jgi:hypothetical protein
MRQQSRTDIEHEQSGKEVWHIISNSQIMALRIGKQLRALFASTIL